MCLRRHHYTVAHNFAKFLHHECSSKLAIMSSLNYYYYYYIRLTAFFQDNLGKPAPER